jgi:hypothetical protein
MHFINAVDIAVIEVLCRYDVYAGKVSRNRFGSFHAFDEALFDIAFHKAWTFSLRVVAARASQRSPTVINPSRVFKEDNYDDNKVTKKIKIEGRIVTPL